MKLQRDGRLLVFGGCYSNLQATQALFHQAQRLGIAASNMICTGDIIAYGADAQATLALVRRAGVAVVMGNCEEAFGAQSDDCGCGFPKGSACDVLAAAWYAHAAAEIDEFDRHYMAHLPKHIEIAVAGKKILFVHGNVERINAFVFPSASDLELEHQLELSGCDALVAGHCGIPFTRTLGDKVWHNAGSIGMPANDGTPRGWFSTIDVQDGDISIISHPLIYDYRAAADSMRQVGLPEPYAAALETGIWPSLDILPAVERYFTGVALEQRAIAEEIPKVVLQRLENLWVNTGSRCNLACRNCFMESTPRNDDLSYFRLADFKAILAQLPPTVVEIGFTGGEPFMNPDIMAMLDMCLASGRRALVLTNAMRPMQKHATALARLVASHAGGLAIRVSLDHYQPGRHEILRGKGSFKPSLAGLKLLAELGANLSVAARTPWGETQAMIRAGFAGLFAEQGLGLDAHNPEALVLFPEMDMAAHDVTRVTSQALSLLGEDNPLMCVNSRMVLRRKGEASMSFTPCTLLPDVNLGSSLAQALAPVTLAHARCGQFCVYGGASCAGAPG
ncbi:MAG: radical SAM protein [Acidocella sp.]|nr:radical SAM protein [Acidocella sp.]